MRGDDDDDDDTEAPDPDTDEAPAKKPESEGRGLPPGHILKTRTILLGESLSPETFQQLAEALLVLEADNPTAPVTIVVNTYGGREASAFAAHDLIRATRVPVKVLASGVCGGVANLVYCAVPKERRYSTPSTTFLLHQSYGGSYGAASDVAIAAAELQNVRRQVLTLLSNATGQSVERLDRDTRRKLTLDTPSAANYGIVGRVITARAELAA